MHPLVHKINAARAARRVRRAEELHALWEERRRSSRPYLYVSPSIAYPSR
jgi:hypothetical protein